jgi:hypothetical protein
VGAIVEVFIPDIGDFKDVPIIEVMVNQGDTVQSGDSLITLESDKAMLEVPAPCAGVVKEMKVQMGDKVSQGSPILTLELDEGAGVALGATKRITRTHQAAAIGGAMNEHQRWILFAAAAVVVAMLLFPPFRSQGINGLVMSAGYGFLFDPPRHPWSNNYYASIDLGTLLVQWVAVFLVAGILWFAFRDKG